MPDQQNLAQALRDTDELVRLEETQVSLPACSCGMTPKLWTEQNTRTGLFVGRVTCPNCSEATHYCSADHETARNEAIRRWRG